MKSDLSLKKHIGINASPADVWEALTNPDLIRQYFFGTQALSEWKEGKPILFTGVWEGRQYTDKGMILKLEQERLFQYTYWSSFSGLDDVAGNYAVITFELFPMDGHTDLVLTQQNFADETSYEHSDKNWDGVLKKMKELIES